MHTELTREKRLAQVTDHCAFDDAAVSGYKKFIWGVSSGPRWPGLTFAINRRSDDDRVLGGYFARDV
jgi:adenosylcobyric acid synthase